jgi:hypothetical protein
MNTSWHRVLIDYSLEWITVFCFFSGFIEHRSRVYQKSCERYCKLCKLELRLWEHIDCCAGGVSDSRVCCGTWPARSPRKLPGILRVRFDDAHTVQLKIVAWLRAIA